MGSNGVHVIVSCYTHLELSATKFHRSTYKIVVSLFKDYRFLKFLFWVLFGMKVSRNKIGERRKHLESSANTSEIVRGDTVASNMDANNGFTFTEVNSVKASSMKVISCHFSADGKWLATAGHDKKAVLWYADGLKPKSTFEGHTSLITDVCFSPSMPYLATSSFDKTIRVWDAGNPRDSLHIFRGHSTCAVSVDFHPNRNDLICSCDGNGEIRYWSITDSNCAGVFKGGTSHIKFQPRLGRYLAAAEDNAVSILDVETQARQDLLQGHVKPIQFLCWDPSGEYIASVSEDAIRLWKLGSGGEGECIQELISNGCKFHSCVFHPANSSLLIIGCDQSLELWNTAENKSMTVPAHEGLIASLAVSTVTRLVASASHDKFVKLWI